MSNNRKLAHSEKTVKLFSSERSRDKANANRAIEGLNIADQQLAATEYTARSLDATNAHLVALVQAQQETNRLLAVIAGALAGQQPEVQAQVAQAVQQVPAPPVPAVPMQAPAPQYAPQQW